MNKGKATPSAGVQADYIQEDKAFSYSDLFVEKGKHGKKTKTTFAGKLLKHNAFPIFLSCLVYIIQSLPYYVVPICSANIINIITQALQTGISNQYIVEICINAVVMLTVILLNVPATRLRYGIVSRIIRRISANIKSILVRKLQMLSITYHKNLQKGKVQSKFIKDTESIDSFMSNLLHTLIPNIITVIIATSISVYRNAYVALFFVLIIPVNVLLIHSFRKKMRITNHDYRVKTEEVSAKLSTMMTMIPVTKSHGLEQTEIKNLNSSINSQAGSGIKMDKNIANFGAWSWVINALLKNLCFVFCGFLALKQIINVGDIVLYESMFAQISTTITTIINSMPIIASGLEAVRSVSEIMNATDVEAHLNNVPSRDIDGNIRFENVSYKYPDSPEYAVKNFSLDVKKGECIAFVGSSGSGKSTIMNLIIGFVNPTGGNIYIDGKNMKDIDLMDYRHHISVVPQSSILFPGTIKENITYGLKRYSNEQLEKAVEMANINEFMDLLPKGLDTDVGELGDKLSGGQKQRITIARALIRDPKILILDEATSALDNISELHVQKAIASSIKGRTTFIVAHRLSTIRDADKIVVMEKGECVEFGQYHELIEKKGKFYQLKMLSEIENKNAEEALS